MNADLREQALIPDKLYFKIGEVCEITGLKQHVLRYWELEFPILKPQRVGSRQRLYRRSDVENILRIKRLLKEEGFTISGAKKKMTRKHCQSSPCSAPKANVVTVADKNHATIFQCIKRELLALSKILKG